MRTGAALGIVVVLVAPLLRAQTVDAVDPAEEEEHRREREAQYARNHFTLGLAANRTRASGVVEEDFWLGRVDGAYVIPLEEGAGPLWMMRFGLGGGPIDDGFVFTLPTSIAYGFRTPAIVGYGGLTFGVGGAAGDGDAEIGALFGGLAALGFSAERISVFLEARLEFMPLQAGRHLTLWGYGPVVAFKL